MIHPTRKMMLVTAILASALLASTALAHVKDVDGSRMQARAIALGSTQNDSVMPPRDRVDWRSVRVKKSQELVVMTTIKEAKGVAKLQLLDARGKSLGVVNFRQRTGTVRSNVKPGIYYISVSSNALLRYSITVK